MDLDAIAGELYTTDPDHFVAQRKIQVARAKAAGHRELARQIATLRRPTRSAWIVNLIATQAPDELAGLLDLATALAQAQQCLSGPDLRRLSAQRHVAIAALARRGGQLADVRGHHPSESTMREVIQTLQAALSDPTIATLVRAGRLEQAQSYGGFGPTPAFAAAPSDSLPAAPEPRNDQPPAPEAGKEAEIAAHDRLIERLTTAQDRLDRIVAQIDRATQQRGKLADRAERQAGLVDELRAQLERAEAGLHEATAELAQHNTRLTELEQSRQLAEEAVAAALSALTDE